MNRDHLLKRWAQWQAQFSKLSFRERILAGAGVFGLLLMAWHFAFLAPAISEQERLQQRFEQAQKELKSLGMEEQALVSAMSSDPSLVLRKRVDNLQAELNALDQHVQQMSAGLISAQRLPELLQAILKETSGLELVAMRIAAPQKLSLQTTAKESEDELIEPDPEPVNRSQEIAGLTPFFDKATTSAEIAEARVAGVYRHSVRLRLHGTYFSVVDFLQRLEKLEWSFYWEFIEYQVDAYPRGDVTLEVYTLSTEKGVME
ncbi:MSHA biogenesis protein, MshJ [Teredinibacter turnerae T7901]|uniref:MSHA biogenesis protein, MshJ n=1 Tax=Teredinibacter turnerae (strain ATCC 39867 / T7901) TaxID=377629 RepID=C5BR21_TERTT|nr:OmpH family outer membrane protein [Teredinibacter turnerae]ACR10673.1 MSHA biogenesis protein, MshJ [Teredinibacter turnerae T7901]